MLMLVMLAPAAAQAPEQVHVSLADEGLVVQFATLEPVAPHLEPGVSWRTGNGSWSWSAAELAGVGHSLSSLASSTFVYAARIMASQGDVIEYRLGTRGIDGESLQGPRSITLPRPDTLRFIAMGDIGFDALDADGNAHGASAPAEIRRIALQQQADLLVVPGDLAYDDSNPGWDRFFRFIEPLAAHMPFMPSIGNHERSNDVEGYRQYLARMVLPGDEQKYLFRAGPVTFITLNSDAICKRDAGRVDPDPECPVGTGSVDAEVLAWLDDALAQAQSDESPWTVVYFHHQTYSFGRRGDDEAILQHWVPRFEAAGVDVVLAAHDHLYSRSHPIRDGSAAANASYVQGMGPIHVISGGGGRSLYPLRDGPQPDHIAHAQRVHHLVRFDVTADTLRMAAIDINGTTIDAFTLSRTAATPMENPSKATPVTPPLLLLALVAAARAHLRPPKG